MTPVQHDETDLLDDLREVSGVLGCGYPVVPARDELAARDEQTTPADLAVLAGALEGYEEPDS